MRTKRRKVPVTSQTGNGSSSKPSTNPKGKSNSASPAASANLIRRFHVLLKRKAQLCQLLSAPSSSKLRQENLGWKEELLHLEAEMEEMGGLAAYQRMSTIGQGKDRGGGSEGVLKGWLDDLGLRKEHLRRIEMGYPRLRLLEVGALKPDNYVECARWIEVFPIDLRSNHPDIQQQDFLEMDLEENTGKWDAISLSLVVNFVPEPFERGRMLRNTHKMLKDNGLLFLALPLPCVSNSRYMTEDHLSNLMAYIGFKEVRKRWKEGGKMAYWLFQRAEQHALNQRPKHEFIKKMVLREGKRNNFCILL